MASTTIQRTPSSSGSNSVFTMSMWIKRSNLGVAQCLWSNGGSPQGQMSILAGDDLIVYDGASTVINTNRLFRDPGAWYHIVLACDAGATGNDKVKLYINGVLETSFATDNRSSFSDLNNVNQSGQEMSIGSNGASGQYFDGVMSHINLIDGTAYGADTFGSIDATTGEWKIKTSPSVTYGTNGFFLKMEDSSNMDLDSSSNALTFTTNGTLTKTEDCPSNVFATWNPLMPNSITYSNGNTTCTQTADANYRNAWTTIATPTTGKFYAEFKAVSGFSAINKAIGYIDISQTFDADIHIEQYSIGGSYGSNGRASYNQTIDSSVPTFTDGDIIGLALDLDNGKAYYHKNGTYINSGNPTTGSNGYTVTTGKQYTFSAIVINLGGANVWSANFGNGYFGTTAVASAGTNASGIGIFEYDVPTGYTALSTKGLNE